MKKPSMNQSALLKKQIALDLVTLSTESLSQESLVTMSKNMLNNLSNFVPEVLGNILTFKQHFLEDTSDIRLSRDNRKFLETIEKIPYVSMQHDAAFVPEGFKGKYLDYLSLLKGAPVIAKDAQLSVIPQFKRAVASIVSNPDLGRELNSEMIRLLRERTKMRDRFTEDLNTFFDKGSSSTNAIISQVIDRNNDWKQVLHLLEETSMGITAIDRTKMLKQVDEISHLLTVLTNKIKSGGYDDMSPENIMMLSEGTYQLATEVEFYAVMHYRVMTLNVAINDTKAALIKNHSV